MQERLSTDLLIIGSGIAGCTAALTAAKRGLSVTLLTKEKDPSECNTRYAQGGIIGAGKDDTAQLLAQDIVEAADGLAWPDAVQALAHEGPTLVKRLLIEEADVPFDRDDDGRIDCTAEAAHSRRRIYHCKDATGREIEIALLKAVKSHRGINLLSRHTAIDLITEAHHSLDPLAIYRDNPCLGAYVFDEATSLVRLVLSRKTILATGGLGQVFLHTTNPKGSTGDGLAMAARAGARIINAEYVQFHPTALFHRDADRFLISESVRGEGGWLLNHDGQRFMERYAPEALELAPRDVVARAIHQEMERTGRPCVFLDIANHVHAGMNVKKRFPTIYETCKTFGIDITRDAIPVVPAAHYFCGGPKVDLYGQTSIPNLHCIGECSCTGLHGANRLASTSLLEGLVWGHSSANRVADCLDEEPLIGAARIAHIPDWEDKGLSEESDPTLLRQDWNTLKSTMWNYAGIVRTQKRLQRALDDMAYLLRRVEQFYRSTRLSREIIELRNGILAARLIAHAASRNKSSHGCHYRTS